MILLLPMAAFAVTVEPLPHGEYADTEVSTNIAFVVERPAMTRIEFTVSLDATPTNNVEVAIGTDANGDGNLAVEESAYAFGWDCGTWFVRERDQGSSSGASASRRDADGTNERRENVCAEETAAGYGVELGEGNAARMGLNLRVG